MINKINNSNLYTKTNALIVGGTSLIGVLGGIAKTQFIDKPDIQKGLEGEFLKYKRNVTLNEISIADAFVRQTENQKLRDEFNNLCDYFYNDVTKKITKNNIIAGALIGIALGITGVVIKNLLTKNKGDTNEANTNKV